MTPADIRALRAAGYGDLWRHILGSDDGDLACVPRLLFDPLCHSDHVCRPVVRQTSVDRHPRVHFDPSRGVVIHHDSVVTPIENGKSLIELTGGHSA